MNKGRVTIIQTNQAAECVYLYQMLVNLSTKRRQILFFLKRTHTEAKLLQNQQMKRKGVKYKNNPLSNYIVTAQ